MKTKTIFKSMMMAVCCLGIVTLASCKDDKDDNKGLKFSVAKVEVAQGASAKVTIGNGTQPYTAKSTNEKLATVKVDKNMMTVTGVAVGKASIVVTDKNKKTGTLSHPYGISSLAGYCQGANGHLLAFAIMDHDMSVLDARVLQKKLCEILVKPAQKNS